jgi:tetratricopeptide (TPR) repeat protein
MGDRAFSLGNFEEALLSFTDAITLHTATPMDPNRLHVYHSCRAATSLKLGIALDALDDAKLVLELQPDWSDGFLLKGEALACLERFVEALRMYTSGLAVCGTTDVFQHRLNGLASEMARRQAYQVKGEEGS